VSVPSPTPDSPTGSSVGANAQSVASVERLRASRDQGLNVISRTGGWRRQLRSVVRDRQIDRHDVINALVASLTVEAVVLREERSSGGTQQLINRPQSQHARQRNQRPERGPRFSTADASHRADTDARLVRKSRQTEPLPTRKSIEPSTQPRVLSRGELRFKASGRAHALSFPQHS
jgi:hypothetical protein